MCKQERRVLLVAYLLVSGCFQAVQSMQVLGCRPGYQRVISYNTSILRPSNIYATNQDTNVNPDDYLFHRNNIPLRLWCSETLISSIDTTKQLAKLSLEQELSIQVNLTETILITQIASSGFSNGFVNNFTLFYGTGQYSQQIMDKTSGQTFIVRKIDTVFTLERPFKASWLKLEIHDGIITPSGRICWHLTLYGCPVEHVITRQPQVPKTRAQPSTNTQPLPTASHSTSLSAYTTSLHCPRSTANLQLVPTPSQTTHQPSHITLTHSRPTYTSSQAYTPSHITLTPSQTPILVTVIVKDYQILVIALPVALSTILITLCIATVSVCICHRNYRRKTNSTLNRSQMISPGVNCLRGEGNGASCQSRIYSHSTSLLPLTTLSTVSTSNNTVYENNVSRVTQAISTETWDYDEPCPINSNSLESSTSMVNNPTYRIPYPPVVVRSQRDPLPPPPRSQTQLERRQRTVNNRIRETRSLHSFDDDLANDYETPL